MEERDGLMALLIAVGDEIYDRGEDPALGELLSNRWSGCWTTTRRHSLSVHSGAHVQGPGPGLHRAVVVKDRWRTRLSV